MFLFWRAVKTNMGDRYMNIYTQQSIRQIFILLASLMISWTFVVSTSTNQRPGNMTALLYDYVMNCGVGMLCDPDVVWTTISGGDEKAEMHTCNPCSCDDDCHIFGTCCPDLAFKYLDRQPLYQCLHNRYTKSSSNSAAAQPYYYMITSCPSTGSDSDLKRRCTEIDTTSNLDPILHLPVTSNSTGQTYRNVYCALCHKDPDALEGLWTTDVKCKTSVTFDQYSSTAELLRAAVSAGGCYVTFFPKEWMASRTCNADVKTWATTHIGICNVTCKWRQYDPDVEWACAHYTLPYGREGYQRKYNNVFCRSCNEDFSGDEFISSCNVTGNWTTYDAGTEWRCKNYQAEEGGNFLKLNVYQNRSIRNYFCCTCNGRTCSIECISPFDPFPKASFRNLFDFSGGIGEYMHLDTTGDGCTENEVLDTNTVSAKTISLHDRPI
jgi:hypothetical protein